MTYAVYKAESVRESRGGFGATPVGPSEAVFPSWDAAYDHALDLGGDSGGVSVTARTATRPETPAARRALANAGRYSYVRSERDTEPPSAPDAADVEAFEAEIATYGEGQARLRNLARKSQGK